MTWAVLAFAVIVCVEIALRLPFSETMGQLLSVARRSVSTMRSDRISDHWKELAVGAYARKTLGGTLLLAGLILIVLAALILPLFVVDILWQIGAVETQTTLVGIVFSTAVALAYLSVRRWF